MLEPRRISLLVFSLASLALSANGAQAGNVCDGKRWVAAPVLALGDSSGIGGTGRSSDDTGIGGTGHGDGSGMGGTGHGDNTGIGGTGHGGDDEGIGGSGRSGEGMGGTGAVASGVRGGEGIGGTGHGPIGDPGALAHDETGMGGTGIVGVIAGFGSICVNGLELHYDASTPTSVDGSPAGTGSLALGQVVSVRVSQSRGRYQAQEISVLNTVSGRVQRVDAANSSVHILDQVLRLPAKALATVRPGEWLVVSGNRLPDGAILPTRIERQIGGGEESIMGPTSTVGAQGFRIGQLEVRTRAGQSAPIPGAEVLVRGRTENGVLQADSIVAQPRAAFNAPVSRLDIQGYVRQASGHSLNVDGVAVALPPGQFASNVGQNEPAVGSRVAVSARVEADGRIISERLTLESAAADLRSFSQTKNEPGHGIGASESDTAKPTTAAETSRPGIERPGVEIERPEIERPEIERPEIERPEIERPEIERPEIERPEIERPEIERPEIERPEIERPEIERPEIERPEIERPEVVRPEIERPEVVRPEIERPDIPSNDR